MRKILRAAYFGPVVWLTTVAMTLLLTAPPAAAQLEPVLPRVAVVQVANQSGSSVQNLAGRAALALNNKLAQSGKYRVLGQAEVDAALQANGIQLPLRSDVRNSSLLRLANSLRADYLLLAMVDSVEVDAEKQLAAVQGTMQIFGRQAETDVALVETTAFNVARSNNEPILIDDALDQTAHYLVRDMATNLGVIGKVAAPPMEETVRVTLEETDHLRYGAQLLLLRNGLAYAIYEVQASDPAESECRLVKWLKPEMKPAVNDEVQLYRQGTGKMLLDDSDWDPGKDVHTPAERNRKSRSNMWAMIGGLALLGVGVWALTAKKGDREDARTTGLISPANNSTLEVDNSGAFTSGVSFVGTSVLSSDSLVLEIARDPNFTNLAYTERKTGEQVNQGGTGGTGTGNGNTPGQNETAVQVAFGPISATVFTPGTYYWRITSISGASAHPSGTWSFTTVPVGGGAGGAGNFLRSPDSVTAIPSSGSVLLQWTPVPGATGYEIWRRVLTPRFANELATGRTFRPNTGGNVWLRSEGRRSPRMDRRSRRSSILSSGGGRQDASLLAGFSKLAETGADMLSYVDTSIGNGTEYQYVVLTKSAAGTTPLASAQGASFASTTPLGTSPPATPANLAALAGDNQVVLSWSPNNEADLAGYRVYRSTSPNGNFFDPANLVTDAQSPALQELSAGPNDVSVIDSNVRNGLTVYYRIQAVQVRTLVNGSERGGLESPLSDAVAATPNAAPAQELQVIQPPNGSVIDADRPLLAWRGVAGAVEYTVQISTDPNFAVGTVIQTTSTETEIIYPANLPALQVGTQYYIRVGVFENAQQAFRFGPISSFTRGTVQRYTTTVTASQGGQLKHGARVTIDDADTGEVTPAQFILAPKPGNAPYTISAVFNEPNGTRLSGSVTYSPGTGISAIDIPLMVEGVAPAAPTGVAATGQTDRIVLRWNPDPNLGGAGAVADRYSIRRRTNTAEGVFAEIAQVDATGAGAAQELFFTDFNVQRGVRYFYRVVALSAAGVPSVPSVAADAVAGVGVIQVITPQDNQTFEADVNGINWRSQIDFAWVSVPSASRYVFEIGLDPDLHRLLSDGNQIVPAGASPSTAVELGDTAPNGFQFVHDGDANTVPLYWRVVAVDESNRILNQTEARRIFVNQPGLMATP